MSGLSFWDTVRGHHLADVLIQCLPKIAKENVKIEQYVVNERTEWFENTVREEVEKGNRYVNHQVIGENVVIIFEHTVEKW